MIQKLGKYRIIEKLGAGAAGAVYKAYDEVLDRCVAVKTMAADIKWNQELKLSFYREVRAAASLQHPNIAIVHDLGEEGEIVYIVTELLEGKDLKAIIRERENMPLESKISIMAQVSDGLSHAHQCGIIHRDIKPGNIHVTPAGNVKITDFGIAHIPLSEVTRSGECLGTLMYMSPEQIRGGSCDSRSDMFSAGVVFYEFLTYTHPFRDKNIAKTMDNLLFQTKLPFADRMPDSPAGLWTVLDTCMAKEPEKRYSSMRDVAQACRKILEDMNVSATKYNMDIGQPAPARETPVEQDGLPQPLLPGPPQRTTAADPEAMSRATALFMSAQSMMGEGRPEEALILLREAVGVLGPKEECVQLLAEARRMIEERRQASVGELLKSAREELAASQFAQAQRSISRVLELEPDQADAIELQRALAGVEAQTVQVEGRKQQKSKESALPKEDHTWGKPSSGGYRRLLRPLSVPITVFAAWLQRTARASRSISESSLWSPPSMRIDNVHFSITGPPSFAAGAKSEIQFWAHLEKQREIVLKRARQSLKLPGNSRMMVESGGPFRLARGTVLTVRVYVEEIEVQEATKPILWVGEIGSAAFVLSVPRNSKPGPRSGFASVRVNDCEIARVDFVLEIRKASRKRKELVVRTKTYRKAFASYASQDRNEVLARVQGILKVAPTLDIFIDVLRLRSGQYWEHELRERILDNDVFYLFWSRNARDSEWVTKEWRYAYTQKGIDFIDPIPLESPETVPPPQELASRHFGDPLFGWLNRSDTNAATS